ncbi:MAG: site-specific DNA-methyltransferase, partial [Bacteroidales bacterium]|nr:site-specific DNA-methyltransferase [Bacteroidales bacterium]
RQDIIWHKPNSMPESVKDRCTKAHEYIFLFSKSRKYYYDYEAIMESAAYDGRKDTKMKDSRKYSQQQTFAARGHERWRYKDGRYVCNKRSVWKVSTCRYKGSHFAVFPQEIIVDCVKAGCPPNGIVLDPFMGAGTTAIVASKLNRNFVGMELNEKYIRIAEKRLHDELGVFYTECLSSI